MATGTSISYISSAATDTHIALPRAEGGYRPHRAPDARPAGLDWDALTPTCASCGQKSGRLDDSALCPTCRGEKPADVFAKPGRTVVTAATKSTRVTSTYDQLDDDEVAERFTAPTQTPAAATTGEPDAAAGTKTPAAGTGKGKPTRQPAKPREPKARTRSGPERIQLPTRDVVDAYQAGETLQQIANRYGCSHPVIARVLADAGVPRRGAPIERTPELVETVRRLYVDEGLSQPEVAERIGTSAKLVQSVMAEHGIARRPQVARRPADRAGGLKQRIADMGVSSRDIKAWAVTEGHLPAMQVGLPPARLVELYAAAHEAGEEVDQHGEQTASNQGSEDATPQVSPGEQDSGVTSPGILFAPKSHPLDDDTFVLVPLSHVAIKAIREWAGGDPSRHGTLPAATLSAYAAAHDPATTTGATA